jgi:heme exporter protein B
LTIFAVQNDFLNSNMNWIKTISWLIRKEILLEWRQKYALGGIVLYVFSTIFIVHLSVLKVNVNVWNALYWIIVLFASVNAIVKSFIQENSNRQLYYYTLTHPTAIILSKIIYNTLLLLIINVLTFIVFRFVAGNPVVDTPRFLLAIGLGSIGFGITFTFIAAIAAKAANAATLMAILSFPVILPILATLIELSFSAIRLQDTSVIGHNIQTLFAIDAILLALCFVLFPYLWRD